ncbi:hypothetical protein SAMD00023353_7800320 [Rosellinia necatrix]|uniref:Uncharacterized protein n=1 Tax=Rosellinia necatrix TaxID=77044 RepID=A0A1S8ABV6_ROSNE|nr:hypothetical protein SAMD00023353_7800320 [Rosellinia necatrix]
MCTGIVHVYRCRCGAVLYKIKDATRGFTCFTARKNGIRGVCRRGVEYSYYDRVSEENCLYCEIYLGTEPLNITADECDEGGEPWPEDSAVVSLLDQEREANGKDRRRKDIDEDDEDGGVKVR